MSVVGSVALGLSLALSSTPATAGPAAQDPPPAPENLRLVLDDDGAVERFAWDRPSGSGEAPLFYEVNYFFANEGRWSAQVFWTTRDTFLEAAGTFGGGVECGPTHHPSDEWVVWVTYRTADGRSAPSNEVSMCLA